MEYKVVSNFGNGNIQALKTIKEIMGLKVNDNDCMTFDFRPYGENNPFSNLVIGNALRAYKKNHTHEMRFIPNDGNYLSHLGFYHMIGADYGKELGEAKPNSNYVPIRRLHFSDDFYSGIEKTSDDLSQLLHFDADLQSFLKYIFIETIRNVYEHADTNEVYIAAQKWPSKSLLEIAIVDSGCGVAESLRNVYKNKTEKELMYHAGLPGISARSNHGYLGRDDGWRNSGYGLYLLRRLAVSYGGSFMLCSGNIALHQAEQVKEYETLYSGTAVAIRINTNTKNNFQNVREKILREGEKKAKEIADSVKKASKSSGGHYRA